MSGEHFAFDDYISDTRSIEAELSKLALDMLQHVKLDPEKDYLGLMAASFAYKQLEHFKSIRLLVDAGQYRDAVAICRIMMEGVIILKWASEEPTERPLNWIKYSAVERYRRLYDTPMYAEHKALIESDLKLYGNQFLKKESRTKPFSEITPNDYIPNWRGIPAGDKFEKKGIKDIFKDTGHGEIHETIYNPSSGWLHWDSLSLQEAVGIDGGAFIYGVETKHLGVASLAVGFDSLNETSNLLDDHFKLGYTSKLTNLGNDHRAILERIKRK
jgi:hypothetical protein